MPDLRETIPDFKDIDKLQNTATVEDLASKYLDLRREMDSTARMPGDDAPSEDKVRALRRLGQVKAPEDYDVGLIQNERLRSQLDKLRESAFESGVPKEAWAKLAVGLENQLKQSDEAMQEQSKTLKNEYLHALGDKSVQHLEAAENALKMLNTQNPELGKRFSLDNPDHLILLSEFGVHVKPSDGNQPPLGGGVPGDVDAPSTASFEEVYQALRKSTTVTGNDMESRVKRQELTDAADQLMRKHVTGKGEPGVEAWRRWREERDHQ